MSEENNETPLRIVVGIDFTDLGDHALREAVRYARRFEGAEIHPVHVIDAPASKAAIPETERALAEASSMLRERVVEAVKTRGTMWDQVFSFHTRMGDPSKAIEQVAIDIEADLIVVGTHGRRGLAKMLIGSVAESLVARAHCPVLIARPKQFEGLEKSERPEPPRPGEKLSADGRVLMTERIRIGGRSSHIGGLL
ncbi:MAG: universal stress protein [Sandaracinaceae bacterium]